MMARKVVHLSEKHTAEVEVATDGVWLSLGRHDDDGYRLSANVDPDELVEWLHAAIELVELFGKVPP